MPLVSLAEHMRCNASDRVLQSRDETVEAVCVMLRDVCDRMEGMMSGSHMLHRHTIRCANPSPVTTRTPALQGQLRYAPCCRACVWAHLREV